MTLHDELRSVIEGNVHRNRDFFRHLLEERLLTEFDHVARPFQMIGLLIAIEFQVSRQNHALLFKLKNKTVSRRIDLLGRAPTSIERNLEVSHGGFKLKLCGAPESPDAFEPLSGNGAERQNRTRIATRHIALNDGAIALCGRSLFEVGQWGID